MSYLRRPPYSILSATIADALVHYSSVMSLQAIQEKIVYLYGTIAGAPGRLDAWIEIAPLNAAASYVRLGAVQNIVASGALIFPWTAHSTFARVAVQAPLWAAGSWVVTAQFEGKS